MVLLGVALVAVLIPLPLRAAPSSSQGGWTAVSATARFSHSATLLATGEVLVAGGCVKVDPTGCSTATGAVEIYNPKNKKWTSTGKMGTPRLGHTATLLRNGKVLVAGGCPKGAGGSCIFTSEVASAELYDPVRGRWSTTGDMKVPHFGHTAVLLGDGRVLALGTGRAPDGSFALENAEIYDPAKGTWTPVATAQYGRRNHTATLLRTGAVLVVGGTFQAVGTGFSASELYDPIRDTWTPTLAEPSTPAGLHTATLLEGGKVLVAGGQHLDQKQSTEIYDPEGVSDPEHPEIKVGAWQKAPPLGVPRVSHTATLLTSGKVLVVGGSAAQQPDGEPIAGTRLSSAELYDPVARRWSSAPGMKHARSSTLLTVSGVAAPAFTATRLEDGRVLVVGGAFRAEANEATPAGKRPVAVNSAELYTPAGFKEPAGQRPMAAVGVGGLLVLGLVGAVLWARRRRSAGT